MLTCGSLYLNMAPFFPVFVEGKFNADSPTDEIDSLMISLCISAFMTAQLVCVFIHARTISIMGRKRATLVGFGVMALTNILIGLAAFIPVEHPRLFTGIVITLRILQGYGDSLACTVILSIASMTFKGEDNFADVMGWHQSAYGAGMVIGPATGSLVFGVFGYEMTMVFYALLAIFCFILAAYMLPNSLDEYDPMSPRFHRRSNSELADE